LHVRCVHDLEDHEPTLEQEIAPTRAAQRRIEQGRLLERAQVFFAADLLAHQVFSPAEEQEWARLRMDIPPGSVVDVTSRTIQGRLLLLPSPEVNDAIRGVLGRGLALFDVKVHAFVFLGNHFHALLSPADAAELARFMAHIKRNISEEIGRLCSTWSFRCTRFRRRDRS
jgi:hypothetical protein